MLLVSEIAGLAYSTIAVYDADLPMPLNEWTHEADDQGFAWRAGSVTFALLEDYDWVLVDVYRDEEPPDLPPPTRAIVVPFEVGPSGRVNIDTLQAVLAELHLAPGPCALLFETATFLPPEEVVVEGKVVNAWCRLTFTHWALGEARIVVADPDLRPTYPLRMDARSAD